MNLNLDMVNIFIGQNNSGKSNILDAIEFTLSEHSKDNTLYYEKSDIAITVEFSKKTQTKYQLPGREGVLSLKGQRKHLTFPGASLPDNKALTQMLSAHFKRLDTEAFADFDQIEKDFHDLFNYPTQLDNFKRILKQHFPKISATKNALDIRYENDGLYEGKRRVTIDRLGSGFQRIFTMLLYIFHPQYSIVMIGEPEIHLHPAIAKKLLWAMQNSNAGQVLFTTHSPLFITPVTLPQVVRVTKHDNTTEAVALSQINYNYKRLIQELNADNLEMFFTDEVVLVEGVSDKLLIRGLIDKFYKGDKDIKVIQAHGKGNINIYADLLKIFKIPFTVVLDRDAIKSNHLRSLLRHLEIHMPPMNNEELLEQLKQYSIFILPNGDLEANYPRKYQVGDSKSLNALHAANLISEKDFNSKVMVNLKSIINNL